jgi:outer membrane protein assembly factor BamA
MNRVLLALCLAVCMAGPAAAQDPPPVSPPQIFRELRLEGATVYKPDDVLWLLRLRDGTALPSDAAGVAGKLQERYERDGYAEARVTGSFENGRLTLSVDEGRIDEIEIAGVPERDRARILDILGFQAGDIYNTRISGRAAARLERDSGGALRIGRPRDAQPGTADQDADRIALQRRGGRNVLVVPVRSVKARSHVTFGSTGGREDLFSPADGFSPAIVASTTIFDPKHFNHAYLDGFVSYKFGRDDPGFSLGGERPLFGGPWLFVGGEVHDISASDDLWRITSFEQTAVSLTFKNSFRDYYRRQGGQVFSVLRAGSHNEFSVMARWDQHQPLPNSTSYSFFRDDHEFRPALPVADQQVNAFVVGYTFDTTPMSGAGNRGTYARHLKDSLFGGLSRRQPGLRAEWSSEIAGRGLGGDAQFDRHIVNARGHLPITSHTLLSLRGILGTGGGDLPVERLFSLGGIGSVHGYGFKQETGTRMALFNAEYALILRYGAREREAGTIFAFYDAGRVGGVATSDRWLNGIGLGVGAGGVRLEFGFRANAIPHSRQILLRFSPTF